MSIELMSNREKDQYTGFWFTYDDSLLLEKGDIVMYETLSGIEVATIARVGKSTRTTIIDEEDKYWHYNNYTIPREQIIAYKLK